MCRYGVSMLIFKYKELSEWPEVGCTLEIYKEGMKGQTEIEDKGKQRGFGMRDSNNSALVLYVFQPPEHTKS